MFDLGKEKIDVKCDCGKRHSVTLNDVAAKKTIKCSCGINIQLTDKGSSVGKSVSDINKSMKNLDSILKKIGK